MIYYVFVLSKWFILFGSCLSCWQLFILFGSCLSCLTAVYLPVCFVAVRPSTLNNACCMRPYRSVLSSWIFLKMFTFPARNKIVINPVRPITNWTDLAVWILFLVFHPFCAFNRVSRNFPPTNLSICTEMPDMLTSMAACGYNCSLSALKIYFKNTLNHDE